MSKNILNNYFSSINFSGGTGTVTISFNLVDDSNSDTPFQNVTYTGWPKSGQDIRYLTHWLSKIQNSAGGFGDFDMGLSILHKKEGLKVHCNPLQGNYRVELVHREIPVVITGNEFTEYSFLLFWLHFFPCFNNIEIVALVPVMCTGNCQFILQGLKGCFNTL